MTRPPSLPTDSLYKFLAIGCTFAAVAAEVTNAYLHRGYLIELTRSAEEDSRRTSQQLHGLLTLWLDRVDELLVAPAEESATKKNAAEFKRQFLNLLVEAATDERKTLADLRSIRADSAKNVLSSESQRLQSIATWAWTIAFGGYVLWYIKSQRHRDQILRLKKEAMIARRTSRKRAPSAWRRQWWQRVT